MSEQKNMQNAWENAFRVLLKKAKNNDADGLAALRRHYFPIIQQSFSGIDENTVRKAFVSVLNSSPDDIDEGEFLIKLLKQVSTLEESEFNTSPTPVVTPTPDDESDGKGVIVLKRNHVMIAVAIALVFALGIGAGILFSKRDKTPVVPDTAQVAESTPLPSETPEAPFVFTPVPASKPAAQPTANTSETTQASAPTPDPDYLGQVYVKVDYLNIREAPDSESESHGFTNTGDIHDVYDITKSGKYTWYSITPEGNRWIADYQGEWLSYTKF